jgi:uncharacterized protein YjiS (DUF1127 family)
MAVFTTNRTETNDFGVLPKLSNLVSTVVAWNDRRVTRNALGKLTARELDDIGLSRGDINSIT